MQVKAPTAYAGDRSLSPVTHKKITTPRNCPLNVTHQSKCTQTQWKKNFTKFQSENYGLDKYFIDYRI